MKPLISVVIPSYNYENYICGAIESVAAQTYQNIELVVIDDGSSDASMRRVRELIAREDMKGRFPAVILHENGRNLGAHETINKGIRLSHGEYVAILNADDLYEPNRFTVLIGQMDRQSAEWGFSAVRCIDAQGNRLESDEARAFEGIQQKLEGKRFIALAAVAENVSVSTGNLLFSRALYERAGGFKNYKYVHDYDFFLRACLQSEPAYTAQTSYLYRLHGENTFLSIHAEGVRENRVVWLEFYRAVQRGEIGNPVILGNPKYMVEFHEAVREEGKKKETLWKLARNPLMRAGLAVFKKRYGMD